MVKLEIYCKYQKVGELIYNLDNHTDAIKAAYIDYPEYSVYPYIIIASNCESEAK